MDPLSELQVVECGSKGNEESTTTMDRMTKAAKQRVGRMKNNLGLTEKRDELASVSGIDQRNQKIVSSINTYRKNIAGCVKTGFREEAIEKRKKKCDEYSLAADLVADAKELEANGSTCLALVLRRINTALNCVMEEKVRSEMSVEKRVIDGLSRYLEMDKALTKSKERLNHTIIDVDIARKALNSKTHEDARQNELQEELDAHCNKLESLKDSTITDLFTMAAKEQEIALVFAAYVEDQLEYHRFALRTLESVLPEIRRDIANARPRPMFGVDLEEHLRHAGTPISVALDKCCSILRRHGMRERGVFRVNGNNTKIRRMKAAFDAGQIDEETDAFANDPHSVCSVLKSYLRELPDPLLTNRLHGDWVAATKLEGDERLQQVDACLAQLPPAYFNNLAYLVNFLCELLQYEKITMMNAGNLAIVFGPNLVGNGSETDNVTGSKIVETLLMNEERFFSRSQYYQSHLPTPSSSATNSLNRANSTPYGRPSTTRTIQHPRQIFENSSTSGTSLSIDTHSSLRSSTKSLSQSPGDVNNGQQAAQSFSNASFNASPSGIRRPRVTAPMPPPSHHASNNSIDGERLDAMSRSVHHPRPHMGITASTMAQHQQQQSSMVDVMEHLNSLRGLDEGERSQDSSFDSFDELDDDAITRSLDRPLRPPPPSMRPLQGHSSKVRPVSYNIAVGVNTPDGALIDFTQPPIVMESRSRSNTSPGNDVDGKTTADDPQRAVTVHSSITSTGPIHRSIVTIEGPVPPNRSVKPPLPNKPKGLDISPPNSATDKPPPAITGIAPKQSKETTKL